MFVHAHPDDESLWTGGLIARQVAMGGEVAVVMCTWVSGTPRHRELLDALKELGVPDEPILLDYADLKFPSRRRAANGSAMPRSIPRSPNWRRTSADIAPMSSSPTTPTGSMGTPTTSGPTD